MRVDIWLDRLHASITQKSARLVSSVSLIAWTSVRSTRSFFALLRTSGDVPDHVCHCSLGGCVLASFCDVSAHCAITGGGTSAITTRHTLSWQSGEGILTSPRSGMGRPTALSRWKASCVSRHASCVATKRIVA